MPETNSIGNLVGMLYAISPSLAVWATIAGRWGRGLPALAYETRERCPWHIGAVALAFPVGIAVRLLAGLLLEANPTDIEKVRAETLGMALEVAALIALLAIGGSIRLADFGISRERIPGDLAVGVLGFLAAWGPVVLVNYAITELGLRAEGSEHSFLMILKGSQGPAAAIWIAVAVVILAPLVEELLYRVIVQGWLESQISPTAALLYVAAVFSAQHSLDGRPDALPIFPLALVLGYVYQRRHSYLAVVVLHALFNATNLALALLRPAAA